MIVISILTHNVLNVHTDTHIMKYNMQVYILSPSLSEQFGGRTKVTTAIKDNRQHGATICIM